MTLDEVRQAARERLGSVCRVCAVCDGRACAGQMPGMGGVGTGSSFISNFRALAALRLNLRTIHSAANPDIRSCLFGHALEMPILGAPLGGVRMNLNDAMDEDVFCLALLEGARQAGTLGMTGDGPFPELYPAGLAAIRRFGGIPITKPRGLVEIKAAFRQAEEVKALAVGIDMDAAGLLNMTRHGQPVGPKTVAELRELTESTHLPVVLKGIMTVADAQASVEAGAAAIVVSNHGGRALDHTPGTAEVLPAIAQAVKGKVTILADGAVRSGVDVLKLLALGADAVLVGRPLAIAAIGGGAEGVRLVLGQMAEELRAAMILTGCASLSEIGPHIIWNNELVTRR